MNEPVPPGPAHPETRDETPPTCSPSSTGTWALPASHLPERVGRYLIRRELGRGGMGAVYLAHDTQLDRLVALKVPHAAVLGPDGLARFFREARAAARLQHPNICPVHDVGDADGVHYLCMAYIDGEPLAARVAWYATRPPAEVAALVRTLALALEEAHRQGIIHRDLKPANVILCPRGEPVVMDFGLAREVNAAGAAHTQEGVVLGTPAYMAPEQARGEASAVGPACDVYSLGVMLYQLLVGRIPFQGPTLDVLVQQVRDEPPAPSTLRPGLDPHIEAICLKAMAKEPSRRFLSMAELARGLENYLRGVASGEAPALTAEAGPLERAASAALVLLRAWGWEAGAEKIAEQLRHEPAAGVVLLVRWLAGDEAARDEAGEHLSALPSYPALAGWALLGQAWEHNREHRFDRAEKLLLEAEAVADRQDNILQAAIALQRGYWLYHSGRLRQALSALHEALALCGHNHFLTADVLVAMALVYANRNNFQVAHDLIAQARLAHHRFDERRTATRLTRALGELYLEWGHADQAEEVFQKGLDRALRDQDERAQATMFYYLGRVTLQRGKWEKRGGKQAAARQDFDRARQWLDAAIRAHQAAGRTNAEAAAHRDRALLAVAVGDNDTARAHAERAEALFGQGGHEEGLARVHHVRGRLARHDKDYPTAERYFRQALAHFDAIADYLEGTRTQMEIARTMADAGGIPQLVTAAYLDALTRAEACRRTWLVRIIEEELQALDREALWRHVFGRVRGRSAADTGSLAEGASEVATVLFLNLREFVAFCQGLEPGEVMQTLNHIMADLEEGLERAGAQVTAYLGGGLMALVRGPGHAWRAVEAALDLIEVVEELNRPRAVLGLPQVPVQIGVASGLVCLGNIGTYRKMDFTAVGGAVNLASRLVRHAGPQPCISQETRELVEDRFRYAAGGPRALELPGLGRRLVWDVVGRAGLPPRGGNR